MARVILFALLILIAGGVYINSLPGGFHYDDFPLLLDNPVVTSGVFPFEIFLGHYWGRPLTLFSFHWNYQLFGDNPFFFHLFSYFLHLIVVVLSFALARRYSRNDYLAFATALIFAVHPIQTQAVNYVWSRSVLLMSVFVLLCLLFCRRYPLLGLVFLQLAIWSRAEAIVLVVPLIVMIPSVRKSIVIMTGVNAAILVGYLCLTPPENVAWTHSDPVSFWVAAPLALWKYFGLMLWPSQLTIDHPNPAGSVFLTLAALCALAILLVGTVRLRKTCPWLLLGVSWILLFLAPSLLIPNSDLVNESRSYLAFAGFAFILAQLTGMIRRKGLGILSLLLIVSLLYIPTTLGRNQAWQDETLLWEEAVACAPTELRPRYNLGVALARVGELFRATMAFKEALEVSPEDDLSYAALGYCAESRGERSEALRLYKRALSLNPRNTYARLRIEEFGYEGFYY